MVVADRLASFAVVMLACVCLQQAGHAAECGKGEWIGLSDMSVPRLYPGLAVLPDGNVIAMGGGSVFSQDKYNGTWASISSTEIFDFKTFSWSAGPELSERKGRMPSIMLGDGRLFVGCGYPAFGTMRGNCDPKPGGGTLKTEYYNPTSSLFEPGPPAEGGGMATATLSVLPDGKAMFFGLKKAIFDPAQGTLTEFSVSLPGLKMLGDMHTATTLLDGRILFAGGRADGDCSKQTLLYDPKADSWKLGPDMITGRQTHAAVLLKNGDVMMIHGNVCVYANVKRSYTTEIYKVAENKFIPGPPTKYGWYRPNAVTLADGRVMIVGGEIDEHWCRVHTQTEVYDPCTQTWTEGPPQHYTHFESTAVLLPDGRVFVAGGKDTKVAEIFDPNGGCESDGGYDVGLVGAGNQVCVADEDAGNDAASDANGPEPKTISAPGCGCAVMSIDRQF